MTATAIKPKIDDERDLAAVISLYNEVTDRLEHSHERLRGEVGRLREQLDEKNKELARRERLAALGEMAAGVAHEIRNPLAGIELYSSLLERDLKDMPKQRDIARRISQGVRNLEGIVSDTLAFARGADPQLEQVKLGVVLENVLVHVTPQADALGAVIHVDERLMECGCCCDARQVERALCNLVFNALDAAGRGGEVWIRTPDDPDPESVEIVVEDDGPGLDEDLAHRVFNPFFTTKDEGTGLGLAIVHRICEAHGGTVRVGQGRAGGASFTLALPRTSAAHCAS